jgi:DNA-binding SARP family transcriptional activator
MRIQLVTFGGLHALSDTTELEPLLSQRSRAALFVYLAIERRVCREALTAMFWPETGAANARHALRQSLYHLRKILRDDKWIDSRAFELVVRGDVFVDATTFSDAAEHQDLERTVRLYHGPFLDGVHFVDLPSWESWVDARRAKYARLFRRACRKLLDIRLTSHDFADAIATAERWVTPDPTDDEAQHGLISALAAAGERAEAIRQYETYRRLLAPEGLEPLDETRQLVEQLCTERRRAAATWPTARPLRRRPRHPLPASASRVPFTCGLQAE